MVDSVKKLFANGRTSNSHVLERFALEPGEYVVATVHRAANTDDARVFERIVRGLRNIGLPVIFPVHPRTAALGAANGLGKKGDNIVPCEPLPYADMLVLQKQARAIVTDSGGMQKEALVLEVPCVTLREKTEWPETLEDGWNVLVGNDPDSIATMANRPRPEGAPKQYYGSGQTAQNIVALLGDGSAGQIEQRAASR